MTAFETSPNSLVQKFAGSDMANGLPSDAELREAAENLNRYGELDDIQVEQHLYIEAAKVALEKYIVENAGVRVAYPTFIYRMQDETKYGYHVPNPIKLPSLVAGTLELQALGDPNKTLISIDKNGVTVPGYWLNPEYKPGSHDSYMYIDGEKSFHFPESNEAVVELVIGRNANECDIALNGDQNMSRKHLIIKLNPDKTIDIQDISTNKSMIALTGERTREQVIKDLKTQLGVPDEQATQHSDEHEPSN